MVAHGWFEYSDDGALIRHQTEPQAETVTIGADHIHRRREASGFTTTVSIPSQLAPFFALLRALVSGNHEVLVSLLDGHAADMDNSATGWILTLRTDGTTDAAITMILSGCDDVLQAVEVHLPDDTRRRYVFEEPA
ncbi:MAG: hypothetical protein AAF563_03210 [Pseudomonadota bacterium]